ncbi:hypothetical protein ACGFWE_31685 [Streptomyces sp. NPDC048523]|uniref:hypothetical protein n=1 Tax=Streptomyces sp. NPDC048523 TaxID=3365567 RepID=UPI0037210E69
MGRSQPGALTGHDVLDCEIAIEAGSVTGTFPVTLLPRGPGGLGGRLGGPGVRPVRRVAHVRADSFDEVRA